MVRHLSEEEVNMPLELIVKSAKLFDSGQKLQFENLVLAGGQVLRDNFSQRIENAHYLAFLAIDGELAETNAVKNNRPHQRSIEEKSGVELSDDEYLGEVGWLHVVESRRRARLGDLLTSAILAVAGTQGLFATIQSENGAARRLHERHGFCQVGNSWPSTESAGMVVLYTRPGKR
ncbi:MAG: hypothetical protein RID59_04035 [Hoeflea sp.]